MSFSTNYKTEGILCLINEDCMLKCFYPLIPIKDIIVQGLLKEGAKTKEECLKLSDDALISAGIPENLIPLFRRFLCHYDYKGKGIKDIPEANGKTAEELRSLIELMHLPGVKAVRAQLYYRCGLTSLDQFAAYDVQALLDRISSVIKAELLPFSVPFPKELRTQIAVATAFTKYAAESTMTHSLSI